MVYQCGKVVTAQVTDVSGKECKNGSVMTQRTGGVHGEM